jgi:hypothetical protein
MSTPQDEMNEILDGLEEDQEVDETEENIEAKEEEKPPGYKTLEQWTAEGKDPADYKGENAYKAEYERIQEIRELKSTMKTLVDSMSEWKTTQTQEMNRQVEEARQQAQLELNKAKEDEDINAALAAQEKLNSLETQPVQPALNPGIAEFIQKNPILDSNNSKFDQEFFNDMSQFQQTIVDRMTNGDKARIAQLSPTQITRTMQLAYKEAQALHPDKFSSPRNQRQSTPSTKQRNSQKVNFETQLKGIKGSKLNPRDSNPATDIYEMLKAKDPEAAKTFAQNVLGVE